MSSPPSPHPAVPETLQRALDVEARDRGTRASAAPRLGAPRSLVRILNRADVFRALPMHQAIAAMRDAFLLLGQGRAQMPSRLRLDLPRAGAALLAMPVHVQERDLVVVKTVTVHPGNPDHGLPLIRGLVQVIDARDGTQRAMLHGGALTATRTAAVSALATDLLARPNASVLALIGTGEEARSHLEAMAAVRRLDDVRVYSRSASRRQRFVDEARAHGWDGLGIRATGSPQEAVRGADILCTLTTSSTPVFDGVDLSPGSHVNAIGSFRPAAQEVDATTMRRARIIVDSREAALQEAGDLLVPMRQGLLPPNPVAASLDEILAGTRAGRTRPDEITLFKSCGLAIEDAVAADIAVRNAVELGIGHDVEL